MANAKTFLAVSSLYLFLACIGSEALAVDAALVPQVKSTKARLYLDAKEAYALKQKLKDKAFFVDVRTRPGVSYLSMPTVADANIPCVEHPDDAPWTTRTILARNWREA